MNESGEQYRKASVLYLLAGIAFFVLSFVQLASSSARFAVFLAVGIGNLIVSLIMRRKGDQIYRDQEREKRGQKED